MKQYDVYLYGMILATNSFLLQDDYPAPDTYGEIKQNFFLPGGETGTCATVLDSLGCSIRMDGNHIGYQVEPLLRRFYGSKKVDLSSLTFDQSYEGLQDYVIIDKSTRTPFGKFQSYYSDSKKRWNHPRTEDIIKCRVAGLDCFFGEDSDEVAIICRDNNIPYAAIDCAYDRVITKNADIMILSNEFFLSTYPDVTDRTPLYDEYLANCKGLVIITRGSKELYYGRKETGLKTFKPYSVPVVSTLGAGDTFKAGCVYALLHHMSDEETVSFASACAGVACTHFPLPLNPPTLDEIQSLRHQR